MPGERYRVQVSGYVTSVGQTTLNVGAHCPSLRDRFINYRNFNDECPLLLTSTTPSCTNRCVQPGQSWSIPTSIVMVADSTDQIGFWTIQCSEYYYRHTGAVTLSITLLT